MKTSNSIQTFFGLALYSSIVMADPAPPDPPIPIQAMVIPEADIPPPPALHYQDTKYQDDPRFQTLQAAYPAIWRRAWIRVRTALGLRYQDYGPGRITMTLKDLPRQTRGADFANTGGGRGAQNMMFRVEHLMSGLMSWETILTHELTHAVLRHCLGVAHNRLPSWTRESLAAWVAGQGPVETGWILGRALGTDDPLIQRGQSLINGLAGERHQGSDVLEDILTVECLHRTVGQATFSRWVKALADGAEASRALEQTTGMKWAEFCEQAQRYAKERLRSDLKNVHGPYRQAMAAYREKRYEEAAKQFLAIRTTHPAHWASAWCILYEGFCWFELQRWEESLSCFNEIVPQQGEILLFLVPDVMLKRLQAYDALGKREQALAEGQRFLRDHPDPSAPGYEAGKRLCERLENAQPSPDF